MSALIGRHSRRVVLIAGALLAFAGGIAYATIPDGSGVYTACMLKNVGTIRLIDPSLPASNLISHCTSLESKITFDQQGRPGPIGANGAPEFRSWWARGWALRGRKPLWGLGFEGL